MTSLLNLDVYLTEFLKNILPHIPFFDYFFSFFSLRGNSILVWLFVIIIALILEERKNPGISKKDKQFAILFVIIFLSTALIVEFPLKSFFQRQRPLITNVNKSQPITCSKDFSFPSGHSASAFAAASVLIFFDKKRRLFYYSIASLIAYSRIYLGCHYFFDVIAGAIFGFIISKLFLLLFVKE